jgi:cytoskeletal protein CcmA (bactofilin family)
MWGNKKHETPQPTIAKIPEVKAPEVKIPEAKGPEKPAPVAKPASEKTEEKAMSTDAMRPLSTTSSGSTARLGASLHVKGEISGNEDLHIDGSVEGLIQLEDRKLTIGASAKLTADVVAREVVIYGSVKGNLRARDRIEIKKDGSVIGDLTTARIMIEDGAYFKGSIEIDRTASGNETELNKPTFLRATPPAATTPARDSVPAHPTTPKL